MRYIRIALFALALPLAGLASWNLLPKDKPVTETKDLGSISGLTAKAYIEHKGMHVRRTFILAKGNMPYFAGTDDGKGHWETVSLCSYPAPAPPGECITYTMPAVGVGEDATFALWDARLHLNEAVRRLDFGNLFHDFRAVSGPEA